MNIRTERIDITPDKSLFPKLGKAGYSVAEALAELIDNSIDAREKKVEIDIHIDKKNNIITIRDNGLGMNKETAIKSIILGSSSKKQGELGQFGLGLKTACMSLGKTFTIETTSKNSDEAYILKFDEEEFLKNGNWDDFEIGIKKGEDRKKSFTIITIENIKVKFYPTLLDVLKKHLSERFTPFILNKEATIKINNETLTAEPIKVVAGSRKNFTIKLSNGSAINGWTGLLEKGSIERSGFNLYRHNRLIRAHEKLGYIYHPSKMWITGEIFLDSIPVTHNKREFITTDELYIEFFDKFSKTLKPILQEAQDKHRKEQIKDLPREIRETLKDNLLKALNQSEDLKEFAFPGAEKPSRRSDKKEDLLSEKEKRDRSEESIAEIQLIDHKASQSRSPKKTSPRKVHFITIAGEKYRFDYGWDSFDENVAKMAYLDKEKNVIMVILNSNYHILNVIRPDWFYHAIYLTEGIIEVFLKENKQQLDRAMVLRDKLIKKLADIISEDIDQKNISKDVQTIEAQSYLLKRDPANEKKLTENEKKVLKMKIEDGLTYGDIANCIGVSRQRTKQMFDNGLAKINNLGLKRRERVKASTKIDISKLIGLKVADNKGVEDVITNVAEMYNVSVKDVLGDKRKAGLVLPRHTIMYLLRKKLGLSFPKIAKIMKRKDHTTVIYAYNKIVKIMENE